MLLGSVEPGRSRRVAFGDIESGGGSHRHRSVTLPEQIEQLERAAAGGSGTEHMFA